VQCCILLVPQRMLGAISEPAFTSMKKKKENVVFSRYSKVNFEKYAYLKVVLSLIFQMKGNLFLLLL